MKSVSILSPTPLEEPERAASADKAREKSVLGDVDHSFGKPAQRASGTPAVSESDLHVMILGLAYIGMLF